MHSCKVQEDGKTNPTAINHRGYVGCFSVVLFSTLATSFPSLPPPYASPLRVKVIQSLRTENLFSSAQFCVQKYPPRSALWPPFLSYFVGSLLSHASGGFPHRGKKVVRTHRPVVTNYMYRLISFELYIQLSEIRELSQYRKSRSPLSLYIA